MDEQALVGLLESFGGDSSNTTVTFKRKLADDDDLDVDLEGL